MLALQLMERIDVSKLSSDVEVEKWIKDHRDEMAKELQGSPVVWDEEDRWNCALTKFESRSTVYLSRKACSDTVDRSEAAKLFIHEMTHHLAVTDENLADRIAIRFFQIWENQSRLPWCLDAERRHAIVPTGLAGKWIVDAPLAERLGFTPDHYGVTKLEVVDKRTEIERFPGLYDRCAFMAGEIKITGSRGESTPFPFVLVQLGGNPHLVFIEGQHENGEPDFESFHVMMAPAESGEAQDLLFVGDDHPEPLMPFRRQ
jgi:hypothetical protein